MTELQVIEHRNVLDKDFKIYGNLDDPLFLAKDVASWIEHSQPSVMLKNIDNDEKVMNIVHTLGGNQESWFLTEDGLYEVLMQSRKPIAKQFKKEVKRILRDIRKHGLYATEDLLDNPDLLIAVATELKQERAEKEAAQRQLKEQEHQVVFARSVEVSRNSVAVKILATILKQNGVDIGQNRMFQWLRNNGYLSSRPGKSWNMPTQRSMNQGLFELNASPYFHNDGTADTGYTPLVTGKGQVYFVNKFKEEMVLGLEE